MFARILEFVPIYEKKAAFMKVLKNEILPIMHKQTGFLEILPFLPEEKTEKMIVISLWMEKRHAEAYAREFFPAVEQRLKPFLTSHVSWKLYAVETTVCEHFAKTVAA